MTVLATGVAPNCHVAWEQCFVADGSGIARRNLGRGKMKMARWLGGVEIVCFLFLLIMQLFAEHR